MFYFDNQKVGFVGLPASGYGRCSAPTTGLMKGVRIPCLSGF